MPTLIDVLVQTAASAGCAEPTRLRHSLETAADKRQSLMDALVDANMVDEDRFFEKLANGLGIPFDQNGATDAPEGIHNRFPAKIALRHRVFPTQLSNAEATLQDLRATSRSLRSLTEKLESEGAGALVGGKSLPDYKP